MLHAANVFVTKWGCVLSIGTTCVQVYMVHYIKKIQYCLKTLKLHLWLMTKQSNMLFPSALKSGVKSSHNRPSFSVIFRQPFPRYMMTYWPSLNVLVYLYNSDAYFTVWRVLDSHGGYRRSSSTQWNICHNHCAWCWKYVRFNTIFSSNFLTLYMLRFFFHWFASCINTQFYLPTLSSNSCLDLPKVLYSLRTCPTCIPSTRCFLIP